eukprot:NODE_200_length_13167_cov_0.338537.p4 type:complete len:114 gc:universal NODE_200_length_13167_cov_0.338537:5238-4897(-)
MSKTEIFTKHSIKDEVRDLIKNLTKKVNTAVRQRCGGCSEIIEIVTKFIHDYHDQLYLTGITYFSHLRCYFKIQKKWSSMLFNVTNYVNDGISTFPNSCEDIYEKCYFNRNGR